jgi:hypothetical protein
MKKGIFINGMRFIVCLLNLCPLYLVNYELNEWIPNEMDRYLYKVMLNFSIFMALLSYWTATLKKPRKIPDVPPNSNVEMCG